MQICSFLLLTIKLVEGMLMYEFCGFKPSKKSENTTWRGRLETWKKGKKDKISSQHLPEESGNLCPFIKHIRWKFNKLPTIQMIFWQCLFATYEINLAVS
jgi:hypothetical protein